MGTSSYYTSVTSGEFFPIEMKREHFLHKYFALLILMESCVKEKAHSSWRTYVSEYYTSEELRKQAKRRTKMRVLCLTENSDLIWTALIVINWGNKESAN